MRRQLREEPLSNHTSFRIGGPAAFYYEPETREEIRDILRRCKEEGIRTAVIGNGSNLLVGDKGFRGAVIRLGEGFGAIETDGNRLKAEAGALLAKLARTAANVELSGLAFAAGIPGTVGGALVMNAGAYGGEMKDVLESAELLLPDGSVRRFTGAELELSYRHSNIPELGAIVLSAEFVLQSGEKEEILAEMKRYAESRREKQPLEFPSAGSAFKRPAGDIAARLLDAAGCKGLRIGGAAISEKHAGFLVNLDHASAADVRAVLKEAADRVEAQSGIRLEPEIRFLGGVLSMSFSAAVKRELAEMIPEDNGLFSAELQGLLLYGAKLTETDDGVVLRVLGESEESAKKYFTFIKKTDRIKTDFAITIRHPNGKNKSYSAVLSREDAAVLLESAGLGYEDGEFEIGRKSEQKLSGEEARRAFLRGVFLAAGSISDPARFYHLEFVCPDETKAWYLKLLLSALDATAGVVQRKGHYVVYVKDSDDIVNLLGRMGASRALLALEEIRVLKDMRNRVNRTVNCETANLQKTVAAALKQRKDIEYIRDAEGFDDLPSALAEMAEIRLEYPDMSLKELGAQLNPPVGKSGVNHRLRKLSEYADELRGKRKEG